jgi:uncharacterized phage-associated protein
MLGFNYKKAVQSLNFFAVKEGGIIDKMKSMKLIWLSDRAHLRKYGRPILMDRYIAMRYGPVPSKTKDLSECDNVFLDENERTYRDKYLKILHENHNIESIHEPETKVFSETDIQIMEKVYSKFGKDEQFKLSEISHFYPEWKRYKEMLESGEASHIDMNYSDFFKNPEKEGKSDFFQLDKEHLDISMSIFEENRHAYDY